MNEKARIEYWAAQIENTRVDDFERLIRKARINPDDAHAFQLAILQSGSVTAEPSAGPTGASHPGGPESQVSAQRPLGDPRRNVLDRNVATTPSEIVLLGKSSRGYEESRELGHAVTSRTALVTVSELRCDPKALDRVAGFAARCAGLLGGSGIDMTFACPLPGHSGEARIEASGDGIHFYRCSCSERSLSLAAALASTVSGLSPDIRTLTPVEYLTWKFRLVLMTGAVTDPSGPALPPRPAPIPEEHWDALRQYAAVRILAHRPATFQLSRTFAASWFGLHWVARDPDHARDLARTVIDRLRRAGVLERVAQDPSRGGRPGANYYRLAGGGS